MPLGSVFRTKISGVSVLCIHGIHPSPINFGTHFRQYVFDMSVCRACLMCPDNPGSAWKFILDEDAKNVLAMGEFFTKHLVSVTDLKSTRASGLHRIFNSCNYILRQLWISGTSYWLNLVL